MQIGSLGFKRTKVSISVDRCSSCIERDSGSCGSTGVSSSARYLCSGPRHAPGAARRCWQFLPRSEPRLWDRGTLSATCILPRLYQGTDTLYEPKCPVQPTYPACPASVCLHRHICGLPGLTCTDMYCTELSSVSGITRYWDALRLVPGAGIR